MFYKYKFNNNLFLCLNTPPFQKLFFLSLALSSLVLPSLDLGSPPPWQTGAQAVFRSRSGREVRAAAQPIGAPQSGAENWSSPIGATLNWSTTGVKSCKDIWVHFHMMASFNWRTGASLANRILNWVSRIIFSLTKDLLF